jgi:hypothetical protein
MRLYLLCILLCAVVFTPVRSNAQSALNPPILMDLDHANPSAAQSPTTVATAIPADFKPDTSDDPIYACACGCGVFEVGTSTMLPQGTGGMAYVMYDYQDQVTNWNGHTSAPPAQNPDKKIETSFYTAGFQYMFNRSWGIQVEVPIADRYFETTGNAPGNPIVHSTWTALGDMRIEALYTGFFEDQSLGINVGLKLPTGNFTHNNAYGDVDRDSEIGTGSTDLLLGGFFRHHLIARAHLDWFAQIELDLPFLYSSGPIPVDGNPSAPWVNGTYRPGAELDGAAGIYYTGLRIGKVGLVPIAQVIASVRRQDSGSAAADPVQSGYQRILLSPGVEIDAHPLMFYADVELPVYQNTNGDQLIGSFLVKGSVSYRF